MDNFKNKIFVFFSCLCFIFLKTFESFFRHTMYSTGYTKVNCFLNFIIDKIMLAGNLVSPF